MLKDERYHIKPDFFECGKYKLPMGKKTYVMGILNVTPDSFSDGGRYNSVEAALEQARRMVEAGADIIDVGGESTRPGHQPVAPDEEIHRVVPVIEKLSGCLGVPVSVDTSKAAIAERALEAGAVIVNDVWGFQRDPDLAEVTAKFNAGAVVMHNQDHTEYRNLMGDISEFLTRSVEIAMAAGISRNRIAVDPGIGFGKTAEQNIQVLRELGILKRLGLPILLGTSRKSFIGITLGLPVDERLEGTAATIALGIAAGADIVRVHDVKEMVRVARMTDAVIRSGDTSCEDGYVPITSVQ